MFGAYTWIQKIGCKINKFKCLCSVCSFMDPIRIQVKLINLWIIKNPNTLDLKDQVQELNCFKIVFLGFSKVFLYLWIEFLSKGWKFNRGCVFSTYYATIIYFILFQIVKDFRKAFQIQKMGHFFKISCCIPNEPKRCPLPPLSPISLQENKR